MMKVPESEMVDVSMLPIEEFIKVETGNRFPSYRVWREKITSLKGVHHNERGGWYATVDDETFELRKFKPGEFLTYRTDSGDLITGENSILLFQSLEVLL